MVTQQHTIWAISSLTGYQPAYRLLACLRATNLSLCNQPTYGLLVCNGLLASIWASSLSLDYKIFYGLLALLWPTSLSIGYQPIYRLLAHSTSIFSHNGKTNLGGKYNTTDPIKLMMQYFDDPYIDLHYIRLPCGMFVSLDIFI